MAIQTDVREAAPAPTLTESSLASPRLGLRLLHIEDNASDALLAQAYIRSVIPDVVFDSAVRICDVTADIADAASCAILDLSLPDASGLEALHALRQLSPDLPIIVLTGFDDLDMGLSAIRDGAEDYLVKNFVDGDSLQRAIRYAMERRRLTTALTSHESAAEQGAATRSADDHESTLIDMGADAVYSRRDFFTPSRWFG
jgi:two-component system sensor histidine kinase UhpB